MGDADTYQDGRIERLEKKVDKLEEGMTQMRVEQAEQGKDIKTLLQGVEDIKKEWRGCRDNCGANRKAIGDKVMALEKKNQDNDKKMAYVAGAFCVLCFIAQTLSPLLGNFLRDYVLKLLI